MLYNLSIISLINPSTGNNIELFRLENLLSQNIMVTDLIGYFDLLTLMTISKLIASISSGILEESTYLDVQCLTLCYYLEHLLHYAMSINSLIRKNFQKAKEIALRIIQGYDKSRLILQLNKGKVAGFNFIYTI